MKWLDKILHRDRPEPIKAEPKIPETTIIEPTVTDPDNPLRFTSLEEVTAEKDETRKE